MKKTGKVKKAKSVKQDEDSSTEQKIKEAARKVFMTRGYAGARTRDIADEAGINLALLNYYFRSKEKLFQIIMLETVGTFVAGVKVILANHETSLREKTEMIASNYIDTLTANPDLPVFMLSELRANPDHVIGKIGMQGVLDKSSYFKQLKAGARSSGISPVHYFINTVSLIIFPFVGAPILKGIAGITDVEFAKLMQERKVLIAKWIEAMLKVR
jgi:AcrR family transcriptional regulator